MARKITTKKSVEADYLDNDRDNNQHSNIDPQDRDEDNARMAKYDPDNDNDNWGDDREMAAHVRHLRTGVIILFGLALVLLIWSYLNFLCATNLGSDNNTTNWLLQLFYGDRCRRVGSDIGLPRAAGDNDKQQLSLNGTSLSIDGGNSIDLTFLTGAPGLPGPAGSNGTSGFNGANGATGPVGPPGPVVTGDALAGPGVSFTGSGVGRLVGGNLTINNTGVLGVTASGPLASSGGQNPDISLVPCAAAETYVYNGAAWVCTSAPLPYVFQNGLTESPVGTVELGGANAFLHDTILDQAGFDFAINGGVGGNFDQSMTDSVSGEIHGITSGENIFGAPINGSVIYSSPNPALLPFGGEGAYNYALEGQSGLGASDGVAEASNFVFFPIGYTMNHNGVAGSSSINAGSNNLGFNAQDNATGFFSLANFNNNPGVAELYAQGAGTNFSQVYADGANSDMRIYTQTSPGAIASLDLNAGTNFSQWYTQDNFGGTTQTLHDTVAGRINNSVSSGLNFNNLEQNSTFGLIFNSNIAPIFAPNMFSVSNNGDVTFDRELRPGGNAGNAGEILISQGVGLPPIWGAGSFLSSADNGLTVNPAGNVQLGGTLIQDTLIDDDGGFRNLYIGSVAPLGSFYMETLGDNDIVANNISLVANAGINLAMTSALSINGTPGVSGQVLTSQGPGVPPVWGSNSDCPGSVTTFCQNGNSFGSDGVLGTNDGFDQAFVTNGTEKMRITAGGNVGIGTTTPSEALDVVGNEIISDNLAVGGAYGSTVNPDVFINMNVAIAPVNPTAGQNISIDSSTNADVAGSTTFITNSAVAGVNGTLAGDINFVANGDLDTSALYGSFNQVTSGIGSLGLIIGSRQNVGASTDGTIQLLAGNHSIAQSGGTGTTLNGFGNYARLSTNDVASIINQASVYQADLVNSGVMDDAALFRGNFINNGGSITNSIDGLNISGWLSAGGSTATTSRGIYIDDSISIATNNWAIASDSTADSYLTGNLGVGTPTPAARLDVVDLSTDTVGLFTGTSGTCTVDTSLGSVLCASDAKLKENILSMQGSLEKILQLQGVTYNWKNDKEKAEISGFIAQEVEDIIPGLVKELGDGTKVLDKTGMIPYLVEALKSQNGQLEATNQTLTSQGITLNEISTEVADLVTKVDANSTDIETLKAENKKQAEINEQQIQLNNELKQRLQNLEAGN